MNDEMFYGTLPQDTQDFTQVLRGVGRNIKDIGRGVSYYPYDVLGAPVDIINMALQPVGLGSQTPVLGSDYLRNIAQSLGYAQPSTGSGAETAGRFGAALINPAAGARAVGQAGNLVTKGANISADKLVQMITQNPRATAMGVVDETAMPFMQAVAPKAPSLLEPTKSDIGFYSQLEAATIPLQNKGTGDQYLAQISKTAGVKPEEIQWTGLDEFLKGKKSVSKDEILNYLNTNRVDVQEVRLAEPEAQIKFFNEYQIANAGFNSPGYVVYDRNGRFIDGPFDDLIDAELRAERVSAQMGSPKFSQYTLPGGENYREILLTLPEKTRPLTLEEVNAKRANVSAFYPQLTQSEYDSLLQAGEIRQISLGGQQFKSSHFDQPNILAHMRVNDRVVDGKKTLFIEEIQSDWHQAGRKKGYATGQEEKAYVDYLNDLEMRVKNDVISNFIADGASPERAEVLASNLVKGIAQDPRKLADYFGEGAKQMEMHQARIAAREGVPDAPFKTSWHELTLKRAIQEASERGYDQIAFTTGKTQAERYDLSKQIKTIVYGQPDESGRRTVRAITPNGDQLLGGKYSMSEIEDNIGKEMAEKIQKETGEFDQRTGTYAMSGLDLQVGGEGMKGFYDNILPKSLDKLAKKFDAKVGKTEMDGVEVWQMDITPKMRESVTTKGQPLFAVPAIGAGLLGAGMVQDEQMY
jgi:hypothetical protein